MLRYHFIPEICKSANPRYSDLSLQVYRFNVQRSTRQPLLVLNTF